MNNFKIYNLWIFIAVILTTGICLLFTQCKSKSNPDIITGKIIKVHDGDTYDLLLEDNTTLRIRMEGIDAPEKGMPFCRVSKKYLSELCHDKTINVQKTTEDHHGRIVAYSYLEDGRELSREMLKAGLAWHYKEYNSEKELADLELDAQKAKRGLWIYDNPMSPWENRKLHRKGISTKDMFQIKEGEK
jgi:endonuclease YncB( thermonuclease family)